MSTTGQHNVGFRMESVHRPVEHPYDSVYNRLNRANQTTTHAAPIVDNTRQPQATETVVVNQKLMYIVAIIVILSFLVTIATIALTMTSGRSSSTGKTINCTSHKNVSALLHDNKLIVTTANYSSQKQGNAFYSFPEV